VKTKNTTTTKGSRSRVQDWDAYRNNPFWRKKTRCKLHDHKLRNGRCWECDWADAIDELDGKKESNE